MRLLTTPSKHYYEEGSELPFEKLLELAKFDYVNPDILNHFNKLQGDLEYFGDFEYIILQFKTATQTEYIEEYSKGEGFSPGNLRDLLGFSLYSPNFQRSTPVIALGSSWAHKATDSLVPAIWGGRKSREINLCSSSTRWFAGDGFLAKRPKDAEVARSDT